MPPIPADKLTDAQRKIVAEVTSGPRGGVRGPMIPMLRSPDLMASMQQVGEYLRFHNPLPPRLVEMTVLLTARKWTQQYQWSVHYPLAIKEGLKKEIAEAIAVDARPTGLADDEQIVYDFIGELHSTGKVSDPVYSRAVNKFKEQGVVDLIAVSGYYATVGMITDVARTPYQSGDVPMLKPLSR